MKRRAVLGLTLLLVVSASALGAAAVHIARDWRSGDGPGAAGGKHAVVPDSVRITVEVLNATSVRGLARQATMFMRDRGFDVIYYGNARQQLDSTVVLDRSGHPEWAQLAADAFAGATLRSEPDSTRYADVTVLVGADWHPPAKPLYP
jgi:hypothetical protein